MENIKKMTLDQIKITLYDNAELIKQKVEYQKALHAELTIRTAKVKKETHKKK